MKSLRTGATPKGSGVFARTRIPKGTLIIEVTGKPMTTEQVEAAIEAGTLRLDDPFQVGEDSFLKLKGIPYLFNHSCEPNAGFKKGILLTALRDIEPGEEICYDYSLVVCTHCEWEMRCLCGSKHCRKKVGNVASIPKKQLAIYKALRIVPRFVLREV